MNSCLSLKWVLPVLLAVLSAATVSAQDYQYIINKGTITITKYLGSGGDVTVPSTIDGLPVTAIGFGAFASANITSVSVPDTVTAIASRAFEGSPA